MSQIKLHNGAASSKPLKCKISTEKNEQTYSFKEEPSQIKYIIIPPRATTGLLFKNANNVCK